MSTKIKKESWESLVTLVNQGGTWRYVKKIYVKNGSYSVSPTGFDNTWRLVYGIENARSTEAVDTQVSGTYGFTSVNLTYDDPLGDASTYGYTSAATGQTIGQNFDCDPVLNGDYGEGFTVFSFDPGVSVLQNEAVINIKYKRIGSTAAVSGGSAFAAISYSTDATNNTGGGTYTGIVSCSDNNYDTSVQTFQQTISGPLNRQNFKIKVGSVENLAFAITAPGSCESPAPYDSGLFSAGFLIYDIYVTFR